MKWFFFKNIFLKVVKLAGGHETYSLAALRGLKPPLQVVQRVLFKKKHVKNTVFSKNYFRKIGKKNRIKKFFLEVSISFGTSTEWDSKSTTNADAAIRNDYFKSFNDKRRKYDEIDVYKGVFELQTSQK